MVAYFNTRTLWWKQEYLCRYPGSGVRTFFPGARIGSGCSICDGIFTENNVVVDDDVTIKCGVQLWGCVIIENGVLVVPNATFTNLLSLTIWPQMTDGQADEVIAACQHAGAAT